MNRKLKDEDMDILFRGILKLQTVEECYDFFEDLCTIAELRAMVQRFQVARMLDEGRIYSDIVQETGASTATISRVNKCLVYGSDGYRRMLDRLKKDDESLDDPDEESIKASIDLEGREEGSYEVPVDITLPEGYELVDDVVAEINISEISDVSEVENSEE